MSRIRSLLSLALLVWLVGVVIAPPAFAATIIGAVTGFSAAGDLFTITAGQAKVRVDFARADIFRLWLAPDGTFTDPVAGQLAVTTEFGAVNPTYADAGDHYLGTSG